MRLSAAQVGSRREWTPYCRQGFTLLELILVLALIGALLAGTVPALRGFVHGRDAVEEARRFLALTRFASSEAVSRGETMRVWIDVGRNAYGMASFTGSEDAPTVSREYTIPATLGIVLNEEVDDQDVPTVLCLPDGTFDPGDLTAVAICDLTSLSDQIVVVPDELRTRFRVLSETEQ